MEEARKVHFFIPHHPPSQNNRLQGISGHWSRFARAANEWRLLVRGFCPRIEKPLLWPVRATYTFRYLAKDRFDQRHMPDLDNVASTSKIVWDALEHYGVLENDRDIEELVLHREPAIGRTLGISVEVEEM